MTRLGVFAPRDDGLREEIWKGSGIVGSEVADTERLRLDFEGDRRLYPTFEARVRRAAERHLWEGPDGRRGYPTSAMAYVDPDAVVRVGWWDTEEEALEVTDPSALAGWLGENAQ